MVKEHLVCGNILCEGVYSVKEELVCGNILCTVREHFCVREHLVHSNCKE